MKYSIILIAAFASASLAGPIANGRRQNIPTSDDLREPFKGNEKAAANGVGRFCLVQDNDCGDGFECINCPPVGPCYLSFYGTCQPKEQQDEKQQQQEQKQSGVVAKSLGNPQAGKDAQQLQQELCQRLGDMNDGFPGPSCESLVAECEYRILKAKGSYPTWEQVEACMDAKVDPPKPALPQPKGQKEPAALRPGSSSVKSTPALEGVKGPSKPENDPYPCYVVGDDSYKDCMKASNNNTIQCIEVSQKVQNDCEAKANKQETALSHTQLREQLETKVQKVCEKQGLTGPKQYICDSYKLTCIHEAARESTSTPDQIAKCVEQKA